MGVGIARVAARRATRSACTAAHSRASGDERLGRLALGCRQGTIGERGDEDRVVRGVGGRSRGIRSSRSSDGASSRRFPGRLRQARGVGRGEPEVARAGRGRERPAWRSRATTRSAWSAAQAGHPATSASALARSPGSEVAVEQRGDAQRVVLVVPLAEVSHGTAPSGPRAAPEAPAGRDGSATSPSRARRRSSRRSRRSRSPRCRTGRWPTAGRR